MLREIWEAIEEEVGRHGAVGMQGSQQHSSSMMAAPPDDLALKTLAVDLLALLGEGRAFSDVTFEVEGRQVFAHRCVLAVRSPFFRMIFCGNAHVLSSALPRVGPGPGSLPQVIPVGIVGYDIFMLLLQFLYSGTFLISAHHSGRACPDKACRHSHCSSAVQFGLDMLNAAVFFGVDELSTIMQKHLGAMAEKASIEDVMRMLARAGKKDELHLWLLWNLCSKLVAKSGLPVETLQKHLPAEVVKELEAIRHKSGSENQQAVAGISEQKTKRMQKALDSSDIELVKLMVMEGLNLNKAFALHYAVNCSRKVVKTLLDLGAANVNLRGPDGRTPLHMAAQLGDPEKIAVLLDHNADPLMQSATGATAMDIVQAGAAEVLSAGGYNSKVDHNRLRLCLELLERAVMTTPPPLYPPPPPPHPPPPAPPSKVVDTTTSGSPASILTEHGSSTLLPEESDNFQPSMPPRMSMATTSAPNLPVLASSRDAFFSSFSSSNLSGKVHGRDQSGERMRDNSTTSDSISRLLLASNNLGEFANYSQHQHQQMQGSESCNYSMLDTISTLEAEQQPRKLPRLMTTDAKDFPLFHKEMVLKDITNDALESFKNAYNIANAGDEEVSSGWQFYLQEHSDALA